MHGPDAERGGLLSTPVHRLKVNAGCMGWILAQIARLGQPKNGGDSPRVDTPDTPGSDTGEN